MSSGRAVVTGYPATLLCSAGGGWLPPARGARTPDPKSLACARRGAMVRAREKARGDHRTEKPPATAAIRDEALKEAKALGQERSSRLAFSPTQGRGN